MRWKRLIALGAAGGAVVVWIAAAATTSSPVPAPIVARSTPADERGAVLASEIARLHERLRPDATPLQTRDLFQYSPSRRIAAAPAAAVAPSAVAVPEAAPPSPPPFRLIGLAEDGDDNTRVRTAIISSGGELFIVKEGDAVTDRYRVRRIGSDAVELTNTSDEGLLRLGLQ